MLAAARLCRLCARVLLQYRGQQRGPRRRAIRLSEPRDRSRHYRNEERRDSGCVRPAEYRGDCPAVHLRDRLVGDRMCLKLLHQQSDGELRRSRHHHDLQHHHHLSRHPVHDRSCRQSDHASPAAMRILAAKMLRKRSMRGATMVEFAMTATVCLGLLFAVMELSSAVYSYHMVCTAAREGVRYAIVHSPTSANPASTDQIEDYAKGYASGLDRGQLTVTATFPADPRLVTQKD